MAKRPIRYSDRWAGPNGTLSIAGFGLKTPEIAIREGGIGDDMKARAKINPLVRGGSALQ